MKTHSWLDQAQVVKPCRARWADMAGDERVRFCGQCQKHVYNFSAFTQAEAEALIREKEGKLCGRLYRRADGRVLTADCPVGRANYFRRVKMLAGAAAALLLTSFGVQAWSREEIPTPTEQARSQLAQQYEVMVWKIKGWLGIKPPTQVVGILYIPPTPTPPAKTTSPKS